MRGCTRFIFKVRPSGLTELGYIAAGVSPAWFRFMAFNEALVAATSTRCNGEQEPAA
jgi:hypothetical protein